MSDPAPVIFHDLVNAVPPRASRDQFGTVCVLGGSVAGLLAARVLADHARRVVVIDRDDVSDGSRAGHGRPGTPQDQQVHVLLAAGRRWIERWFPGFTGAAMDLGAVLASPDTTLQVMDGRPDAHPGTENHAILQASRPFFEARLRERVVALPNVHLMPARVTGLTLGEGAVTGVLYEADGAAGALDAEFVVDAMGAGSRTGDWLAAHGFERPAVERLRTSLNYATALFRRTGDPYLMDTNCALASFSPGNEIDGVSVAAVSAVEDDRWIVMLAGYGDQKPGRTVDELRAICAKLPDVYSLAAAGAVLREPVTFHQEESRRRTHSGLRLPARMVSVGDAVASFNPVYGQGMSSAVLHASCLATYLADEPDLTTTAAEFFRLQDVVVDAAWMMSAGGDAARLDAINGVEVPAEVAQARAAMQRILAATRVDGDVARAFYDVAFMLKHPASLMTPELMQRVDVAIGADA